MCDACRRSSPPPVRLTQGPLRASGFGVDHLDGPLRRRRFRRGSARLGRNRANASSRPGPARRLPHCGCGNHCQQKQQQPVGTTAATRVTCRWRYRRWRWRWWRRRSVGCRRYICGQRSIASSVQRNHLEVVRGIREQTRVCVIGVRGRRDRNTIPPNAVLHHTDIVRRRSP